MTSAVHKFGSFLLDVAERRLTKSGQPIQLAPKAFDVLAVLVSNSGRLVRTADLLKEVWPEAFVEEGIVSVHVSTLRKAFGDEGRGWIETVPRAGYRFHTAVALGLGVSPLGIETAHLTEVAMLRNPAVYEWYGRGRAHLLAGSMFEIPEAVKAFQNAIQHDPSYPAAHAGLAMAYCGLAEYRLEVPVEAYGKAKSAALRALAMDPASVDAQTALGAVLFLGEWDWRGARQTLERAMQQHPNHTEAHLLYGRLLDAIGSGEEALAAKFKALERDPFSPLVQLQISLSYWNMRRYAEAIEWAEKALQVDPKHPHAREHLAGAYLKTGDHDRFMTESMKHAEVHEVPESATRPFREAYQQGGRAGFVQQVLARTPRHDANAVMLAILLAEAGEMDEAFRFLDTAMQRRDPSIVTLRVGPQWDHLRTDPRFEDRLRKMVFS